MKGKYKTKEDKEVEVLDFDEANNIAYVDFGDGEKKWVADSEFSEWLSQEENINNNKIEENAIQKPRTSSVLQHSQKAVGKTGRGRGRVESSVKRDESSKEKSKIKSKEKSRPTKPTIKKKDAKANKK